MKNNPVRAVNHRAKFSGDISLALLKCHSQDATRRPRWGGVTLGQLLVSCRHFLKHLSSLGFNENTTSTERLFNAPEIDDHAVKIIHTSDVRV